MRKVRADLHLHTCLSPCADIQMQAAAIVEKAKKVGLDMIGVCDHNSAENVVAVVKAGAREGLAVIGGMEVTSSEEVHILGLFGSEQGLMELQETVYENLPGENSESAFGSQVLTDEWGRAVGTTSRLLIGATTLTIEQIIELIHEHAGLAIASHIDRERFGLIGQLGFIPDGLKLDAVEISARDAAGPEYGYPVISSSDAHFLEDIGRSSTCFMVENASFTEIKKALRSELGRRIADN
ncbi:MAG: PHP domain-containing protein [Sedimentisphaerales bacterium]|nr:PHP domain-containing protein [Sedimentisphaerales bacterium]